LQKSRRFLVAIPIILIVLIVAPFLVPLQTYIDQAEQAAGEALGAPVRIGSMHLALLPTPRLNVSDVVVGNDEDFTVEDVAVVPALSTLFSEARTISSLKIKRPVIKRSALELAAALGKGDADDTPTSVAIRRISISRAQLLWPGMDLPEFSADVVLKENNRPESARIVTTDGKVKISLEPEGDKRHITVNAWGWTLPAGVPLLLNRLEGEMTLTDDRLHVRRLDIGLYEGSMSADAVLGWQKNWTLEGRLNVKDVQVAQPVRMVSPSTQLSGWLNGEGEYRASAQEAGKLLEQLQANFGFRVRDGVLDGFDLAKAAALLGTRSGVDGQTRFDTLTGNLNVAGRQYHLRNLDIASGLLRATGDVKIRPNRQLGGEVKVELKKEATLVAIPLQVTGTTESPMLLPTKAALAGAVAGTAVLGPGVGTSLGIQAVDRLKGLFGNNKD
jgi:uncharacterized protein involved in outer membrane biogenesis